MFVNFLMARQGLCLTHLFWFVTASCLVWVFSRENAIQILLNWNFIEFKFYWCTHLFKNIYRTPTVCQGASKHFESGEKKNSNVNWLPTLSSVAMSFISFEFHKFLWVMRTPFYWWTSWGLEMLSNLWSKWRRRIFKEAVLLQTTHWSIVSPWPWRGVGHGFNLIGKESQIWELFWWCHNSLSTLDGIWISYLGLQENKTYTFNCLSLFLTWRTLEPKSLFIFSFLHF